MSMKTPLIYLVFAVSNALAGCGTMTDGTTQQVTFQTNPEAVDVLLVRQFPEDKYWKQQGKPQTAPAREETRSLGKTPLSVQLDRTEGHSVVFSKDGYKTLTMKLTTGRNPNFWGNAAIGGPFGSTTDEASGAIYEYVPSQYFVTLVSTSATTIEQSTGQPQRDKALAFIVRRHTSILANLSQGIGEDWSALMGLLNIGPAQESDARAKVRALALVYPDVGVFATHVTDLYLKK